jgi:asparagine synthase (glutamine-hydrolysing)
LDKVFTFAETGASWNRAFGRGNGLEVRSPFVHSGYFNLGLGAIGTNGKDLMRRLAGEYLPENVTSAPKHPQEMPVDHWIRGSLAESVRERLSELPPEMAAILDPAAVRSVVDRHISGGEDRGWQIISLLTLESWFRQQAG